MDENRPIILIMKVNILNTRRNNLNSKECTHKRHIISSQRIYITHSFNNRVSFFDLFSSILEYPCCYFIKKSKYMERERRRREAYQC